MMWLLPSRRRPQNLQRFAKAAIDAQTSTPGLILVDVEDMADNGGHYTSIARDLPDNWDFAICPYESMGEKVEWARSTLQSVDKPWDFIGLLGDDNVPVTPRWDAHCVATIRGYNFVSTDDGWQAPRRAAGATIWSKELVALTGYIFPPGLKHLYIDDIWETIGRLADNWHILMDVLVEHRHVNRGMAASDETHTIAYSEERWASDREVYMEWRRCHMMRVVDNIRMLKARLT